MKGDFTRFTHRPEQHYTRVLKQQGRVDLDADWNESVEIFTHLERTEAIDVIGRCGVPVHGGGFKVDAAGGSLSISRGRIYVDGILCSNEDASDPAAVPIDDQPDLPGYAPPLDGDGVYLAYLDVWERHITYVEDPEIQEIALGGPDTTTRTRTLCQVKLARIDGEGPLENLECVPFDALPASGRLAARSEPSEEPSNPCVVPATAGYRGLENRLYRVEIHDDGRDADGNQVRTPTFKWSRDNGSVVLPVADGGISGDTTTLKRLGLDEVLTVASGDWVEILGDETELHGRPGTLARIEPDGIDQAKLEVTLSEDVSVHAGESHPKMRRWDHHATDDVALEDGALPIQGDWFELEDGVQVRFDTAGVYHVGDYWVIPARTRQGTVLWPQDGATPAELPRRGITHHYCTLALLLRENGAWTDERDCRPQFPPLTEVDRGGCCLTVQPGESIQQAIDTVVGLGGGCVSLCRGVHRVAGSLRLRHASDVSIGGESATSVVRFSGADDAGRSGFVIESSQRINLHDLFLVSGDAEALVTVRHDEDGRINRQITLRRLLMLNRAASEGAPGLRCAVRLAHADGVLLEQCRLAAEVGIVGLWGNAFDATLPAGAGDGAAGEPVAVGFEELALGTRYRVGDDFRDSGVTITAGPFQWSNGQTTEDGFAEVEDGRRAGGSGQELEVNNINLNFGLAAPCGRLTLRFGDYGGNSNLCVNGVFRNLNSLFDADGERIGGVRVTVTRLTDDLGILELEADPEAIRSFAIGGQELWIDEFACQRAPEAEPPPEYGEGVRDLAMRDCRVRYRDLGVLALSATAWQIDRCAIEPIDERRWSALAGTDSGGDDVDAAARPRERGAALRGALERLFAAPVQVLRGTALQAFSWRDCKIRQSRLAGARGVNVWWWLAGGARENRVVCEDSGLAAFWLQAVELSANRISCNDGAAVSFVGSAQAAISGNRIEAAVGCLRSSLRRAALDLYRAHLRAAVSAYGGGAAPEQDQAVLRLLLEESLRVAGVLDLIALGQTVADRLDAFRRDPAVQDLLSESGFEPPPAQPPEPLLTTLAQGWYESLREFVENPQEPPWWIRLGPAIPVIGLRIDENEMCTDADCILLEQFIAFGGMRISDNILDSSNGQTVRVNVWPYASNAALVVRGLRWLLEQLAAALEGLIDSVTTVEIDDPDVAAAYAPLGAAIGRLFGGLAARLRLWLEALEGASETDFRIAGNTLHSLNTAIEANLFELSVLRNHITMRRRKVRNAELAAALDNLSLDAQLAPVGAVAQVGDVNAVDAGYDSLASDPNAVPLYLDDATSFDRANLGYAAPGVYLDTASPAADTGCADVLRPASGTPSVVVNWASFEADVRQDIGAYRTAVEAGDLPAARLNYLSLGQRLQAATNSYGIWVKAAGCRVAGNQILVPHDAEENFWARGGIRVQGDDRINLLMLLLFVLGELIEDFDPVLGITETLIEGNEIIGGVGHGIDVLETAGGGATKQRVNNDALADILPFQALVDFKVRGNQIRGMAGAGLSIDAATLAVNVEIENNFITDCSNSEEAGRFTLGKGGVVISHAALCRLRGNQVSRCGREGNAAGVLLNAVVGLSFADNQVLRNGGDGSRIGTAGVALRGAFGHVDFCDNELLYNASNGFVWDNRFKQHHVTVGASTQLVFLALIAGLYTRHDFADAGDVHALISNNVLRDPSAGDSSGANLVGALVDLYLSGARLVLNGNACHGAPSWIRDISYGTVAANLFDLRSDFPPLSIIGMGAGVISGNVSTSASISVQNGTGVQHGLNEPPIPGPSPLP